MTLPPFSLERWFARHEFSAPHLLCASDCETLSVDDLLRMEPGAREKLLSLRLGYTESAGAPSLRQEISRLYATVDPGEVLVANGAEEAIFLFLHAALGPGDHAIVHMPCYQSLAEVARSAGAEVSPWQAREEDGWALDLDDLARLVRPSTKVIVLNTPHNPTGWHMPEEDFRGAAAFAEERGITLFSDEVYRGLEHGPRGMLPAGCDCGRRAVSLGVMSKTYGLAGLRIGWVATHDAPLLARLAGMKDYTTICAGGPGELLAEIALRHGARIAARNRAIISSNIELFDAFADRHPGLFAWRRPAAGPIAFPRLLGGDATRFCEEMVRASGVLLLPGSVYEGGGDHVRVGLGRASMPAALNAMEGSLVLGGTVG